MIDDEISSKVILSKENAQMMNYEEKIKQLKKKFF